MRTPPPIPLSWFVSLALGTALAGPSHEDDTALVGEARASITKGEIEEHVNYLASPELEGRDSPSRGLELAAEYIASQFEAAGLAFAPGAHDSGTYLSPFELREIYGTPLSRPVAAGCGLELTVAGEAAHSFEYGTDFLPLGGGDGDFQGELVFAGFGISSKKEKYDDLKSLRLRGKVALIFEGEPRHSRKFDGAEVTREASLWKKLEELTEQGVGGVLVVRRSPPVAKGEATPLPLAYRHGHARWAGGAKGGRIRRPEELPVTLEISMQCASALAGRDLSKVARKVDKSARPTRVKLKDRTVSLRVETDTGKVVVNNVLGMVAGTDPELKTEFVIIGAHYDHIGVDPRGRVGFGADDNASGTAALLEIAQALAGAPARRSILFCAFAAEEKGLLGSKHLASNLPFAKDKAVAMLNMDMLGRGDATEIVVLGLDQTPAFEKILNRAKRLSKTGIRKLTPCSDLGIFKRSDHYSFHEVGIPSLFFFEAYPLEKNKDYHTWRDTVDRVQVDKVTNSARLVFNTTWLLANDDQRPRD